MHYIPFHCVAKKNRLRLQTFCNSVTKAPQVHLLLRITSRGEITRFETNLIGLFYTTTPKKSEIARWIVGCSPIFERPRYMSSHKSTLN